MFLFVVLLFVQIIQTDWILYKWHHAISWLTVADNEYEMITICVKIDCVYTSSKQLDLVHLAQYHQSIKLVSFSFKVLLHSHSPACVWWDLSHRIRNDFLIEAGLSKAHTSKLNGWFPLSVCNYMSMSAISQIQPVWRNKGNKAKAQGRDLCYITVSELLLEWQVHVQ